MEGIANHPKTTMITQVSSTPKSTLVNPSSGGDRVNTDRLVPERQLRRQGITRFAGVDEAGRGPLAGPVVAAAVILPLPWIDDGMPAKFRALNDSKQLSESQRENFYALLTSTPGVEFSVAMADSNLIDALNILRATHHAMNTALSNLNPVPCHALVDGLRVNTLAVPQTALVKGDSRSYSIAAASVIAKVTRDRIMVEADSAWPVYGFARHKGYPTPDHLAALVRHGPCPIHRKSFTPVRLRQPDLFGT